MLHKNMVYEALKLGLSEKAGVYSWKVFDALLDRDHSLNAFSLPLARRIIGRLPDTNLPPVDFLVEIILSSFSNFKSLIAQMDKGIDAESLALDMVTSQLLWQLDNVDITITKVAREK